MKSLLLGFAVSVTLPLACLAVEPTPVPLKLDGSRTTLNWPVGHQTLTAYTLVTGNVSSTLDVVLGIPAGTTLKSSIAVLNGKASDLLAKPKSFASLQAFSQADALNFAKSPCIDFAPGETNVSPTATPIPRPEASSPVCDLLTPEQRAEIAATLAAVYGGSWSDAQVCGYIVSQYPDGIKECDPADPVCQELLGQGATQTQKLTALSAALLTVSNYTIRVSKNACASKSTKYLVRIDLTAPKEAHSPVGFIQLRESSFKGDKAASLKPTSDGRYAPKPIVLISFLGSLCGQRIEIAKWSSSTIKSRAVFLPGDLIPYKGRILTRSPVGQYLKGGKATFEIFNGLTNYGVCFALEKRRQKVNGY